MVPIFNTVLANKEEKEDGVHVAVQLSTVLLCLEAGVREEKVKVTTCFSKSNLKQLAPTGRGPVHLRDAGDPTLTDGGLLRHPRAGH